jgi:hypothetical protein
MASPLTQAGGLTDPSRFAPLHTNRFMTGLWTNRNQLRDAATPFLYEKFYSASRFDSLIGGSNCEVTTRMTLGRRAGFTVYNSQAFPPINRFYSFRCFSTNDEIIHVMADTEGAIYDATGPNTKLNIWNKSAGAGKTTFQSVGNNLFFGDGVDQKKWVQALPPWTASTAFATGKYIVDSNNNLQVAEGGITVGVVMVQVSGNVLTLTLDGTDPELPDNLMSLVGLKFTLSGFTGAAFLNGQTVTIASVPQGMPAYQSNVLKAAFAHADYGPVEESGSATSGTGITGAIQPLWSINIGDYTLDGGQQWICKGNSLEEWGIAPPKVAPTVVQSKLPTTYPAWSTDTYYSTCYLIYDAAGFIQMATTFGQTGSTEPVWNNAPGGTTADNTVVWTCQNDGTYHSGTAYAAGAYIVHANSAGDLYFFKALNAGVTAAVAPTFTSPLASQIIDGSVTWVNVGVAQQWSDITTSSIVGNFGIIPIQGGGSIAIGCGQGQASGTAIALPAGYTASNMLAWSTPGTGWDFGTQVSGVYQSTSAGGVVNSSFQNRSNGFGFTATSNWAAAAWTAGAAVTISIVGGFKYATFTTLNGDLLCVCAGAISSGAVPVPAGFAAAQFLRIAGMSGTSATGNGMNGVQSCSLDGTLTLTALYNDNSGNTWGGTANVFGIFWVLGSGVTSAFVTGGTSINIPTTPGQSLVLIQAALANGGSFTLPAGMGAAQVVTTAAMAGFTPSGTNVAHGWTSCGVTGFTFSGNYRDNSGNNWAGSGNVFAVAAVLDTTAVSGTQTIVDSKGALQNILVSGKSGTITPAWSTLQGSITIDNAASWVNTGRSTAARTQPSQWAYAWKTSITKHTSTASPISAPITMDADNYAFLQGPGSADTQVDLIVIYRIPQGGSTLLYLDEIPAPPPGQMWQYEDQLPDSYLNPQLPAAINGANNPPVPGFRPLAYHLNRTFGAVGNVLNWSNGANQTGDPNQSFDPSNYFTYPSEIVGAWACTLGLLVFTVSEVYIVLGSATDQDPLYTKLYIEGLGLGNYDAFCVNKTTPYLMNTTKLVMALDPSAGLIEPGFPIADQFDQLYQSSTAQLAWHEGAHGDTALYVGNPQTGSWFRMSALSAPEQGLVWSSMGTIAAGFSSMASVEVTKGEKLLLLGPKTNGPILCRDATVNTDNGVPFEWDAMIGSVVLAQPGQIAEIAYFVLESRKVGSRPTVGVMLDEIDGPLHPDFFELLVPSRQDPALQPPSRTLYNDRYDMLQNQSTVWCRHLQIQFSYPAEDAANELLTYTIVGAVHNINRG